MRRRKKYSYTSVPNSLIVFIASVMFIVATASGVVCGTEFYKWYNNAFNLSETVEGQVIEGDEITGERANILVMGVDKSGLLSDTIMLISVDAEGKSISAMSILRDTRVVIGGSYSYKINSLIGTKNKEQATIAAVKSLTGDAPINYYITVKTQAFRDVIDILGGVEYDVPHIPNKFSNGRRGMYYDDPYQDLHIAISEGQQTLDGEQAEGLVRFRDGYANADEERVKVQQDFLKEVVKQKLTLKNANKVSEMYNVAKANIRTNISPATAFRLAKALVGMDLENINTFSMPGAAEYVGNVSYFIANPGKTKELIDQYFIDPAEVVESEQ
ncbi:MAG: LCP family protein [Eubacteriales bacterium]|nr:LCP family protein [Eubacteriales bacterium]